MMQGSLQNVSVPQLFNLIHLAGKSGILTVFRSFMGGTDPEATEPDMTATDHSQMQRSRIFFKDGSPVCNAPGGRDLIRILQKAGKLTDNQVETLGTRSYKNEKSLALLLIGGSYVTQAEIIEALQKQLWSDLYALLGWKQGAFLFEESAIGWDSMIPVDIDLAELLSQHEQRVREYNRLVEAIPDLNATLKFTIDDGKPMRRNLSARAWRIVSTMKPGTSVREVARLMAMGELEVRRAVLELMDAGVVELDTVRVAERRQPADAAPEPDGWEDPSVFDTLVDGIQFAATRLLKQTGGLASAGEHR
jgi:predicted transcriptional regulator